MAPDKVFRHILFTFAKRNLDYMPDFLTEEERSIRMSHIHSASTKPEQVLRKALWRRGFRYRVNDKHLPGSPDIVLPKYRTVIFVHGCFWHGHKGCPNYTVPKTNTDFWTSKIARNQQRDQDTWRQLEAKGWFVIVVWECELKKAKLEETVANVAATIIQNGENLRSDQDNRRKAQEEYRQQRHEQKVRESALTEELRQKFPH